MRMVRVGNGRIFEVPETWAEGEKMILDGLSYHDRRGGNLALQSIAARVAYGMFANDATPDPTEALLHLMWLICHRKGAGLDG